MYIFLFSFLGCCLKYHIWNSSKKKKIPWVPWFSIVTGDSLMVLPPGMVVVFYGRGVGIMYLSNGDFDNNLLWPGVMEWPYNGEFKVECCHTFGASSVLSLVTLRHWVQIFLGSLLVDGEIGLLDSPTSFKKLLEKLYYTWY